MRIIERRQGEQGIDVKCSIPDRPNEVLAQTSPARSNGFHSRVFFLSALFGFVGCTIQPAFL